MDLGSFWEMLHLLLSFCTHFLYSWDKTVRLEIELRRIVDILTFICMIDITSERHKAKHFFICRYFSFYEQLKFRAQLS